jgi:hypothetical protein
MYAYLQIQSNILLSLLGVKLVLLPSFSFASILLTPVNDSILDSGECQFVSCNISFDVCLLLLPSIDTSRSSLICFLYYDDEIPHFELFSLYFFSWMVEFEDGKKWVIESADFLVHQ